MIPGTQYRWVEAREAAALVGGSIIAILFGGFVVAASPAAIGGQGRCRSARPRRQASAVALAPRVVAATRV